MPSIFTRIVRGEIPCYRLAETEEYLAFLDVRPRTRGHTLVITKQEVDYIFDLDAATYAGLLEFARHVAQAVESAVPCQRIGVAVIGLEVPHVHVHLVPLQSMADLDFQRPPAVLSEAEMEATAADIRSHLSSGE